MEYIKKNIGMTIIGVIGLVLSIGCIVLIVKAHNEAGQFQQQVIDIKQQLEKFQRTQFALTPGNVEVANANSALASEKYQTFMAELSEKRAKDSLSSFSELGAKNHLTKICTKMENQLRSSDIAVGSGLTSFTFGNWMGQDVLPEATEIPLIMRNLEIVQELVYLLSQARLESVEEFSRQTDLQPVQRDLYEYISFGLRVSGTITSVRNLLNSFNQASYFYIVRSVDLSASGTGAAAASSPREAPRGGSPEFGPGPGGPPPGGVTSPVAGTRTYLPKRDRLLFKEPRTVSATIAVDYVEFHIKE